MSASTISEGTYRIFYMEGCLTATGPEHPLLIMSPGMDDKQIWELKKARGEGEFAIMLKHDTKMGASYAQQLHAGTPVTLDDPPKTFKMIQMQPDHYV